MAIAFTPAPATQSPNLRRTDDGRAAAAYYRAIVVTFASVRRWNPGVDLKLVTDVSPPETYDRQLNDLGVEMLLTPFAHRPPDGFWPIFNASLYTIDALQALATDAAGNETVLLLDPDIVCTGDLTPVIDAITADMWVAYPLEGSYAEKSQGLDAEHAAELHQLLDETLVGPATHYGGELYGFTRQAAAPVLERAEAAWELALNHWKEQRPHFVTEEHLLNYALRRVRIIEATPYIRRIWTTPVHRTVVGDEDRLLLWHLPAEKDRGFRALSAVAADRSSWFWHAEREEFVRQAGRLVGIPRRGVRRWAYDVCGGAVRAVQRQVGRRTRRHRGGTVPLQHP